MKQQLKFLFSVIFIINMTTSNKNHDEQYRYDIYLRLYPNIIVKLRLRNYAKIHIFRTIILFTFFIGILV